MSGSMKTIFSPRNESAIETRAYKAGSVEIIKQCVVISRYLPSKFKSEQIFSKLNSVYSSVSIKLKKIFEKIKFKYIELMSLKQVVLTLNFKINSTETVMFQKIFLCKNVKNNFNKLWEINF